MPSSSGMILNVAAVVARSLDVFINRLLHTARVPIWMKKVPE
jgi:hypothetical protein